MSEPGDFVLVRLPRSIVVELPALVAKLNERMHELLERNTDGPLEATEQAELAVLVQMAQLAEIVAMAVRLPPSRSPTEIDRLARLGRAWARGMTRAAVEAAAERLPLEAGHAAAIASACEAAAKWYEAIELYLQIVEHPERATVVEERKVAEVLNGVPAIIERRAMLDSVRAGTAIMSYEPGEVIRTCSSPTNCGAPVRKGSVHCLVHAPTAEHGREKKRSRSRLPRPRRIHRRPLLVSRQCSNSVDIECTLRISPSVTFAANEARRTSAPTMWTVALSVLIAAAAVLVAELVARTPWDADKPHPIVPIILPDLVIGAECRDVDALHRFTRHCPPRPDAPDDEKEEWQRRYGR